MPLSQRAKLNMIYHLALRYIALLRVLCGGLFVLQGLILGIRDIPRAELEPLLKQIAAGQTKAIEAIYRHYQASVFAFIRFRIRDDEAAEEILNDTFFTAFRKPDQYDGTSSFMTWLCGIAKNICGTWLRKQQSAMQQATVVVDGEVLGNLPDPNWGILENLESREAHEVLRECMDQLPLAHREAFFWVWFEEEPIQRVADKMACPVGTIKSRLFNARLKIADCVKNAFGLGVANV